MSWWYSQIGSMYSGFGPEPLRLELVHPRACSSRSCPFGNQVDLFPNVLADIGGPERPVCGSNASRQMLRTPYAQISPRALSLPTNGLSFGTAYARPGSFASTSSRKIEPLSVLRFWPFSIGSSAAPPSPRPTYNLPSGPNAIVPPLWFQNGCGTRRSLLRLRVGRLLRFLIGREPRDHRHVRLGVLLGVEDEELPVGFELRMERQAEEAFFVLVVLVGDVRLEIEEQPRLGVGLVENVDIPPCEAMKMRPVPSLPWVSTIGRSI